MGPVFERASVDDIDELLRLYRRVYGRGYSLPLGTDPQVMAAEITSDRTAWLVHRHNGRVMASIVGNIDDRLGKMQGLVVHPELRGGGVAQAAVSQLSELMLDSGLCDSVYGTARTTSTAPQRVCLRAGFRAYGIFPNLRKAARHETMVLLARHQEGVLESRHPVHRVPAELGPLVAALTEVAGMPVQPELVPDVEGTFQRSDEARPVVELIEAQQFVQRRYQQKMTNPGRGFYPFHTPNVLLAAGDGSYEVFAHLSGTDGYCTLIGALPNPMAVAEHLDQLIDQLTDYGAFYVETLIPLHAFDELTQLLAHGFLPAAAYPAMRRDGDKFRDYVVMARTMQPLDFRGLAIDAAFKPFTEQYIEAWKHMYLNTRGVFR
ncbi:ribosomal protein S18 acetylase RimI-like enzyme [Crossiella equi]|uniref:Ribosomal protein S18 acetylase RimI-like enzyme n=1 Tax=Crossiella equi TaxID=130796 RepID=A0ABS5A3Z2_9PSEU|nr:GNAT family N-acetyltransferase [Crossiella equi]MBP2471292.1 ribosomal protein S18 acetylase RimI-like enzyme [Crossiella equi]